MRRSSHNSEAWYHAREFGASPVPVAGMAGCQPAAGLSVTAAAALPILPLPRCPGACWRLARATRGRKMDKVLRDASAAVADVPNGATIMVGGFSAPGIPRTLIRALDEQGARDLTIIANSAAGMGDTPELGTLVARGQVRKAILSYPVARQPNSAFERAYVAGAIELELVPQGTLAERIRAGGAGVPAFYTPTAADTILGEGKPRAVFDGRECVLETALRADFALAHAEIADRLGNLTYHAAARNFNPIIAMAARITVVEANRIVEAG